MEQQSQKRGYTVFSADPDYCSGKTDTARWITERTHALYREEAERILDTALAGPL